MDYQALSDYFHKLDRSAFLDDGIKEYAGFDRALPIGHGQTISQPSLVLAMTYQLDPDKSCSVLEIGTGSGYQTALLAAFSGIVYTVERIPELSKSAREKLDKLGFRNIMYKIGDGSEGWKEKAPFDRVIATAAAGRVPEALVDQLKPGGRMIAPVGPQGLQELMLITKGKDSKVSAAPLGKVAFVEFKGRYGWDTRGRSEYKTD